MTPGPNTKKDTQVRDALLTLAADISTLHRPQLASSLWLRAELRARHNTRQQAIDRATLPLRLMSAVGILTAILTATFVLHQSWVTPTPHALHTLLKWIAPNLVLLLAGCVLLIRSAQSPTHPIAVNY